jgi:hypothetical protein
MKKYIFLIISILATTIGFSQNTPDYKNWIVDFTKSRSSYYGVQLDKLELNDKYTVAYFSFYNLDFSTQQIEACNSFHIRSKGKKIASFVKAENIPTRYVDKTGFSCADFESAMKIRPGQFVRFRVYFTRIPEYLNTIDIIEYDGQKNCEFDIFNLNITKKEPLPPKNPSLVEAKPRVNTPPKIEDKKEIKPKPQAIKPKPSKAPTVSSDDDEPLIASKKIEEPVKKIEPKKEIPKKEESKIVEAKPTLPPPVTNVEKRQVSVRKEYTVKTKTLYLEIWDNDKEDGDKVSIMLNNRWILKGIAVTKNRKKYEIPLEMGDNILVFHADNLGTAPPNTAAIKFNDGMDEQTIVLNSDMDKSEAIRLIRN